MYRDADAGRTRPVDREMFRIGAQMLLVDPDEEAPAPVVELRKEKVTAGAG